MFRTIYLFAGLAITQSVCAQNWKREDVGFSSSGISSRGISLYTGIEGEPEEFPAFRECWLRKPVEDQGLLGICFLREAPEKTFRSDWRRGNGG